MPPPTRSEVSFESGGETCAAWLWRPDAARPHPCAPYSKLGKLRCPVLVVVAERDTTTTAAPAVRAAQRSPNAELIRYPIGHFAIYVEPQFDRTVADQTEFLVRNLVGHPAAATAVPA